MSPPKEKAALQGGLFNSDNYDERNVARTDTESNLLPKNVQALTETGAQFHWRKSASDIIGRCPLCAGKIVIHESAPWALCVGEIRCPAGQIAFSELLAAIGRTK